MNNNMLFGILIPFLGTTLGAAMVFFFRKEIKPKVQKIFLGFASGVMIAASIWSLLIPAMDMTEGGKAVQWIPATVGFLLGMVFLLILDSLIPHLHLDTKKPEGVKSKLRRTTMLILAVTLHNIPEGMAVGVVFAGVLVGNTGISIAGAITLAIRNCNTEFSRRSNYFFTTKK